MVQIQGALDRGVHLGGGRDQQDGAIFKGTEPVRTDPTRIVCGKVTYAGAAGDGQRPFRREANRDR